jgi:hypothetical protein
LLLDLLQLCDGVLDVHGIALVTKPHNWGFIAAAQRTDRFFHAAEAGIAVRILLSKDGDLLQGEPPHFHQIAYHSRSFFGVAGAIVEHIAVGRIAFEQAGAGEGSEEQHLAIKCVG